MQDVNVVVVFCSRDKLTERLALAAAVGAVQGRAFIRLRRLPDDAGAEIDPELAREYVAPRDADAEWADAIIAGMPAGADSAATGFERYFDSLKALRDRGRPAGKIGAPFTEGDGTASLHAAMQRAGLSTVAMVSDPDAATAARLQGRRVAEAARSLRPKA